MNCTSMLKALKFMALTRRRSHQLSSVVCFVFSRWASPTRTEYCCHDRETECHRHNHVMKCLRTGIPCKELLQLVENQDSAYIRCCGFLYMRFGCCPEKLWDHLGEYCLDDQEFEPSKSSPQFTITVGEYVEAVGTLRTGREHIDAVRDRLAHRQSKEQHALVVTMMWR